LIMWVWKNYKLKIFFHQNFLYIFHPFPFVFFCSLYSEDIFNPEVLYKVSLS
jgi:hypothetical protein